MSTIIKVQNCLKIDKCSYCTTYMTVLKGFIAYKIGTIFVFLKGYQTVASLSSERLILFQMSYFYYFIRSTKLRRNYNFFCFGEAKHFYSSFKLIRLAFINEFKIIKNLFACTSSMNYYTKFATLMAYIHKASTK